MDAELEIEPKLGAEPDGHSAAIRQVIAAAIRTWLRYIAPLTLLSAIALCPLLVIALWVRVPVDQAGATADVRLSWTLIAVAWLGQLVLVGAASAMTQAQLSQRAAFGGGVRQLVRAIVPCLTAAAAIAVGSLALAVPGVLLLVVLSLTGTSRERGVPAALLDGLAAARKHLPIAALAVAGMLAIDAAIGAAGYGAFIRALPTRPTPAQLAGARDLVRWVAIALVIASPLPATVLATIRSLGAP